MASIRELSVLSNSDLSVEAKVRVKEVLAYPEYDAAAPNRPRVFAIPRASAFPAASAEQRHRKS